MRDEMICPSLLPKQYEKEMEKLRQWVGGDDGTERVIVLGYWESQKNFDELAILRLRNRYNEAWCLVAQP